MRANDSEGNEYSSIQDMWIKELDPNWKQMEIDQNVQIEGERVGGIKEWYDKQKKYWDEQPTTVDGVLGGYGKHHELEAEYSVKVLTKYTEYLPSRKRAIDIGAGIGRVVKTVLVHVFEEIDLADQSPVQVEEAKTNVPFVKK